MSGKWFPLILKNSKHFWCVDDLDISFLIFIFVSFENFPFVASFRGQMICEIIMWFVAMDDFHHYYYITTRAFTKWLELVLYKRCRISLSFLFHLICVIAMGGLFYCVVQVLSQHNQVKNVTNLWNVAVYRIYAINSTGMCSNSP